MGCNRITRIMVALALVLATLAPSTAPSAENDVQVARYSTVAALPSAAQVEPLTAVITIIIPEQLTTVDEALLYVLRRSGYRLARDEAADPATSVLARQPLPEVHRRLGPITVASALTTLAGPVWSMVVDPVHRLVSFELVPAYAAIGSMQHASLAEGTRDSLATECDRYRNPTWCHPL